MFPSYLLKLVLMLLIQKVGISDLITSLEEVHDKIDSNDDGKVDVLDLYDWVGKKIDMWFSKA